MKPLHVLLIHRDNDNYRNLCGWWSYPVPEFTWRAVKVPAFNFVTNGNVAGVDMIVMDDWIFGTVNKDGKPMAYVVVDSARSPAQLKRNQIQAEQADMVLVDSDRLWKFDVAGVPVRRFAYAVNEKLFYPRQQTHDVAFLCWPTPERIPVRSMVERICKGNDWRFLNGTYQDFRAYAEAIGKAKIVVHKAHVEHARSWRVFDVMASHGCLLSSPLPIVDGDGTEKGIHYHEYTNEKDLEDKLTYLMTGDNAETTAEAGYQHVMKYHTWRVRASELRQMVYEAFGI